MTEYTKHYYQINGKFESRMNPNYPPYHCFTTCKCDKCGEWYEADRLLYSRVTIFPSEEHQAAFAWLEEQAAEAWNRRADDV